MKKLFIKIFIVSLSVLMFAGCRTSAVYNVQDATIVAAADKPATMEQVQKAILRAGASLGWSMKAESEGRIIGTLFLRDHMAKVAIDYTTTSYSITYQDSSNLKYDAENNTIHSNYNGWVQNLQRNIQAQMSLL